MKRIFCDGIFDLFHEGHVEHLKKIKNMFGDVYLIVGVLSDKQATEYKRKPIYNESQRISLVKNCKYVKKVITSYPL